MPSNIVIGPVVNHHQRQAASTLIKRMYSWRGYKTEGVCHHANNPNRIALAVWQKEDLIATLALGRDSHEGLLSEKLYAKEVAGLRKKGRIICEFSRFAIDPEYSSRRLQSKLFSTAHQYARSFFGATDAVIEVNPRHARFYEREFGFSQIGDLRHCPRVQAPAVLMHRDIPPPSLYPI